MKLDIAPDFPLPGFWSDRAVAEVVYEFGGKRYYLRQLDAFMLYRTADRDVVEHTLFVPFPGGVRAVTPPNKAARPATGKSSAITKPTALPPPLLPETIFSETIFAQQLQTGQNGRFALYNCPLARDCEAALFFRQDGTGFFRDYHTANGYSAHDASEQIDFVWSGQLQGIAAPADILHAGTEQVQPLCEEVFVNQVWPRMKDPFVRYADTPNEALHFLCGSALELEHITRCILHSEPDGFDSLNIYQEADPFGDEEDGCLDVVYTAQTADAQGGRLNEWPPHLLKLLGLAFQVNTFRGHEWVYSRYSSKKRRKNYRKEPLRVVYKIAPPSAHERAEALLTLWEWLEGKVTEEERRKLLSIESGEL